MNKRTNNFRNFLQESAWQFLLDQQIHFLPVYPSKIAKFNGWQLHTYMEIAEMLKTDVASLIKRYDKEGFVFWSSNENTFVICYKQDFPPPVIRWTLMHEIAHIALDHVTNEFPLLSRVRSEQRPLFESEAQGFARRVLCPSIVLHDCRTIEADEVMSLCGISYEAAQYRSEYMHKLEKRNKFLTHPLERAVEQQFIEFILQYLR